MGRIRMAPVPLLLELPSPSGLPCRRPCHCSQLSRAPASELRPPSAQSSVTSGRTCLTAMQTNSLSTLDGDISPWPTALVREMMDFGNMELWEHRSGSQAMIKSMDLFILHVVQRSHARPGFNRV